MNLLSVNPYLNNNSYIPKSNAGTLIQPDKIQNNTTVNITDEFKDKKQKLLKEFSLITTVMYTCAIVYLRVKSILIK